MTKEEIKNMDAGEEMDNLVAEKVMGWHKGIYVSILEGRAYRGSSEDWLDSEGNFICGMGKYPDEFDDEDFHILHWHPSQSVLWAWDVVEKLSSRYWDLNLETGSKSPLTIATFYQTKNQIRFIGCGETVPLAICRAALLAVEEE